MINGLLDKGLDSYRGNIFQELKNLLAAERPAATGLDFGSGDGWFARQFLGAGLVTDLTAVEVKLRDGCLYEPVLFDGRRLPFPDRAFELSYSIDVLHHCDDPLATLCEVLRCTRRLFAIKDHTYRSVFGRMSLSFLEELGNRRFGIPSRHRFQRGWEWFAAIEREGFKLRRLVHPAPCNEGLLGWAANRWHFCAVWERQSDAT
jgi:SAM-dependent methyltransferase